MGLKSLIFSSVVLPAMLGLSVASSAAVASDLPDVDLNAIRVQQTELRAQVLAGDDVFEDMNNQDRKQLVNTQADLLELLNGKTSFAELSERQQLKVFNSLEQIKAWVNNAEDQRMICTREVVTGSHRKSKVCKTVAQRRQEREDSRRKLESEFQGGFCRPGGSGASCN